MKLSKYLSDTAAILNDQNYSFTSQQQLIDWVNEARRQASYRTGCLRRLVTGQSAFGASAQPGLAVPGVAQPGMIPNAVPFGGTSNGATQGTLFTVPGAERYPYEGFFNPVLKATYAGVDHIFDCVTCSVNWGGASRPNLDWVPWDNFQAYCRAYAVQNTSYPSVWSVYNDGPQGEIWMFPIPSVAGEIEVDAFVAPSDIYTDNDYDAIPQMFQNAIKYGAAAIAFETSQRYQQSAYMDAKFNERLLIGATGRDRGKSSSYYNTSR